MLEVAARTRAVRLKWVHAWVTEEEEEGQEKIVTPFAEDPRCN